MISKGLIVSVQGYSIETSSEMVMEIANAGAVAIRTDKKINSRLPLIGLKKNKVSNRKKECYITNTLEDVKEVEKWTKYIAIDYRRFNENLKEISDYCKNKRLVVIADISNIKDYENIMEKDYYHTYIATTLSVLYKGDFYPDLNLVSKLKEYECENIIAEGNFRNRHQVCQAYDFGACNVCIGQAITGVYKLTKRFTSVKVD